MPEEPECQKACHSVYVTGVVNCTKVLEICLVTSDTEEERQGCHDRYKICMDRQKDLLQICLDTCGSN